jgi:two-component system, sensor histidine kinase and response regulator
VTCVSDGVAAVRAFESARFDLLLMDLQMPEMDGIAATKEIRRLETLSGGHVPIAAMTAAAMAGDREKCLEAGMDDYIAKPVSPDKLFEAIERLCGVSRQDR